jgi:hypothetical protein
VSIANWVKTTDADLLPKRRHLWKVSPPKPGHKRPKAARGEGPSSKRFELDEIVTDTISPSLSDKTDVSGAKQLANVMEPQRVFNGQYPRHKGYRLTPDEAERIIASNPSNREVIHPFLVGQEMLKKGRPTAWVIDFQDRDQMEARSFSEPFAILEQDVLPHVSKLAEKEQAKTGKPTGQDQGWLDTWWRFFRYRPEMIAALNPLPRYMACVEVTKRPIFCFIDSEIRPDKTLEVFAFADDYSFGILQGSPHLSWFDAQCSFFKSDPRYSPSSIFDTFPWPQSPSDADVLAVAEAGRRVRAERTTALKHIKGGLRGVYQAMEQPGRAALKDAHAALDAAVLRAYGFDPKQDLLAQLLRLNYRVAAAERSGEFVTRPGIPADFPQTRAALMSEDRVQFG